MVWRSIVIGPWFVVRSFLGDYQITRVIRGSRINACGVCGRGAGKIAANGNIMAGDDVKENLRFEPAL